MASFDLLEELELSDYYPQKLSFGEAIKLDGEIQNGGSKKYGIEIVKKLLLFDSTAVISVTTEIDKRLNNTGNKETENEVQCVEDVVRQPRERNVRPSWRNENAEPTERRLHPMDLLVVVMNCCDDFLRQALVEKMFTNKLSIPILLPSVRNGSYTLLLFALRSLVPEVHVQDPIRDGSTSLTDTLVDVKIPVVSFIRVGNLHRSKSKLVNGLLNLNSFNTFFHRECQNGSAKRSVSIGSIEAAWFQSSTATEEEFNCKLFTALNLRGNARDYPKQTQFLCQSSTLVVFMVDSCESFKELYENVLTDVDVSPTNIIVCYISSEPPDKVEDKYFKYFEDPSDRIVISAVNYDWFRGAEKMSDADVTKDLRKTIFKLLRPKQGDLDQIPSYSTITRSGQILGFSLDEDKLEYEVGKASADELIDLVSKQPPVCKALVLPLQSEPWKKIGILEREQRGKSHNRIQDEYFIAEKETEKRRQREIQCRSLIQQNEITITFSLKSCCLHGEALWYYLNCCRIKLDARNRVIISKIIEEYQKEKHQKHAQFSIEGEPEVKLSPTELKIENSKIGLEHILRELGQMYEAVISEEIRMKKELKNATLTPDVIHNFPSVVAKLLLKGQPLELMDGDASNVPITWLKEVLNQIRIMTNNAKVFVLSIIGVQSSGKSTLLNALFGLQFPVSAGRCTKGIYCHLVPVDKESLHTEYDYVLVVDTEGLGASQFTGKSTFRDNELATFAIGLADATIVNMKRENWAEMSNILQVVAHGLIRIRKTKAELELMPRCMFVHQNVPAVDAEKRNRLGQEKQLMLLDNAIKEAGRAEGFKEITKFNQVIKYDPDSSHSWYFSDLWSGRPPRARISQNYIGKANELRQYLMQLMGMNASKLTMSGFFLRLSDLWNALLHNDFVLCFRNTQEIMSGTVLNDRISHEVENFKKQNRLEQTMIRELICSFKRFEEFGAEVEGILRKVSNAVEKNFGRMKAILQDVIDVTDISTAFKQKCEVLLNEIKNEEIRRINIETTKDIAVHMKKLQYNSDKRVKDLKASQSDLERRFQEAKKDKFNEKDKKQFDEEWQNLIYYNQNLIRIRKKLVENEIEKTIRESIKKLDRKDELHLGTVLWSELFKTPFDVEMPQVTGNDIVQSQKPHWSTRLVKDFVYSESFVDKANSRFNEAYKKWEFLFQNQRGLEFNASHLEQVIFEIGELLGILRKEEREIPPGKKHEICPVLPPGYNFDRDYIIRFIKFACCYTYNRSVENNNGFISLADPLADIDERRQRFLSCFRPMSAQANIDTVTQQIFDYAKRSFVKNLGELLKTEVCKEDNNNPTFKSKRAFLRTILTDLGRETQNLTHSRRGKQAIFKDFMLYVELAESEASKDFFLDVILKLLKDSLAKEIASETDFQKMVKNNVGKIVEKAKNALKEAETRCKGCAREYLRIFNQDMNITSEIYFVINNLNGFTNAVIEEIDNLYADFLSQANSSFETLVSEDNRAPIQTVFEMIMGCRETCPFCSAPCSQSLQDHAGDHRAIHYPTAMNGTVDIWGLFANTQETRDANEERRRKRKKLALDTCQTLVGTGVDLRTMATMQKYNKWYHRMFNWNYHSFKKYKEIAEYENWDIPYSHDHSTSIFWKWYLAQHVEELAQKYDALCPEIPEAWQQITWEEAHLSLEDS